MKTRTFTDLDLNFFPAPSSQDKTLGVGTITGIISSKTVTGINTLFFQSCNNNDNLYVGSNYIGKIKSIESETSLTLYANLIYAFTGSEYTISVPGDISVKTDANAIKASIKHLVLTMNYERHFHSNIGSQVKALMFELATPMTEILLKRSITDVITSFEPRAVLLDVIINMDNPSHSANITIYFQIVNTSQPLRLDLVLERVR